MTTPSVIDWVETHDHDLYREAVRTADRLRGACPRTSQLNALLGVATNGPYGTREDSWSVRQELCSYARVRAGRRRRDRGDKDKEAAFWSDLAEVFAPGGVLQTRIGEAEEATRVITNAADDVVTEAFARHLIAHLFYAHRPD